MHAHSHLCERSPSSMQNLISERRLRKRRQYVGHNQICGGPQPRNYELFFILGDSMWSKRLNFYNMLPDCLVWYFFFCSYIVIDFQMISRWFWRGIFFGCSVPPQFQNFSDLSPELTRAICAQANLQFSASSESISTELTFWNYYGSAEGAWRGYPGRVCTWASQRWTSF